MYEYMDRFGFNPSRPLDYPSFQLAASGEFADGRLLDAGSDQIDVGRMAIGQDKLNVTPLQMAMVAAAVANGGELMEPRLWSKVIDTDGREDKLDPERMSRVMSEETAGDADRDDGGRGQRGDRRRRGARRGTRSPARPGPRRSTSSGINQAWFIGFAPSDDPQIAIAATVERTSGYGGTVAAPIAQQVLEVLLANSSGTMGTRS